MNSHLQQLYEESEGVVWLVNDELLYESFVHFENAMFFRVSPEFRRNKERSFRRIHSLDSILDYILYCPFWGFCDGLFIDDAY